MDIISQTDDSAVAELNLDHSNYASRSLDRHVQLRPGARASAQPDGPAVVRRRGERELPSRPTSRRRSTTARSTFGSSSEDVDGEARGSGLRDRHRSRRVRPGRCPPTSTRRTRRSSTARSAGPATTARSSSSAPPSRRGRRSCAVSTAPRTSRVSRRRATGSSAGAHTFRVYSIDAAGNVDPTPDEQSWRVKRKDGDSGRTGRWRRRRGNRRAGGRDLKRAELGAICGLRSSVNPATNFLPMARSARMPLDAAAARGAGSACPLLRLLAIYLGVRPAAA